MGQAQRLLLRAGAWGLTAWRVSQIRGAQAKTKAPHFNELLSVLFGSNGQTSAQLCAYWRAGLISFLSPPTKCETEMTNCLRQDEDFYSAKVNQAKQWV